MPLALRAATLGVIAAVLLGILLFRLWALQVLHSDQYVAAAAQNSVRTIVVPSPRGEILDRNGNVIVSNAAGLAVQVDASRMSQPVACAITNGAKQPVPMHPKCGVLKRLAWVLNVPYPRHVAGVRAPCERQPGLSGDAAVQRRPPPDRLRARAALALRRRAVRARLRAQLPVAARVRAAQPEPDRVRGRDHRAEHPRPLLPREAAHDRHGRPGAASRRPTTATCAARTARSRRRSTRPARPSARRT